MPVECELLKDAPVPLEECPVCGENPFEPFLRGLVQRGTRGWCGFGRRRPYCALICSMCKNIVGYEEPVGQFSSYI
jgi:hypothetical protein